MMTRLLLFHQTQDTTRFDRELEAVKRRLAALSAKTLPPPSQRSVDLDQWGAWYDDLVKETCRQFGIRRTAITERPLDLIFEHAVLQRPPFNESGGNFKDAVVLFSILDDLSESPTRGAVLVTRDKDLRSAETLSEAIGRLRVATLDDVISTLEKATSPRALEAIPRRSWVIAVERRREFSVSVGDAWLVGEGFESEGVWAASTCSPCEPGQLVDVRTVVMGATGAAIIGSRTYPNVFYEGSLRLLAEARPLGVGETRTPFSCDGDLIGIVNGSPMGDNTPNFKVSVIGKGTASLFLKSSQLPGEDSLLEFSGIEYHFDEVKLGVALIVITQPPALACEVVRV